MAADENPTHVVTCFLLRRDGGERILLVRRSERVRTYRGAWAAISGYLEPGVTPLEQAYTELREETGLQKDDLTLLRQGTPIHVNDVALGQRWVVHPFLFATEHADRVQTDWEATQAQWVEPSAIAGLHTVPQLAEALEAVYPTGTDNGRP